jgi:hypothetical protein
VPGDFMALDVENIIENIDFTMGMEDMSLTDGEKNRLRDCLNKTVDIDTILQKIIKKHGSENLPQFHAGA